MKEGRHREIEKTVQQALRGFRRVYSTPQEDLAQQARLIALETEARAPDRASDGGYLFTAVRRSLGNYVSKDVTIVSISSNWGAGKENTRRASLFKKSDDPNQEAADERFQHPGESPEDAAIESEAARLRARWRVEFRWALLRALPRLNNEERNALCKQQLALRGQADRHRLGCLRCRLENGCQQFQEALSKAEELTWGCEDVDAAIIDRKFGLDGSDPWSPEETAEKLGVPVRRVYRTWELVSRRLRGSIDVYLLDRRLEELK